MLTKNDSAILILISAAQNYAEACQIRGTQERYILNAENFLRKLKFDEYLPEKYKKPKPPKRSRWPPLWTRMRSTAVPTPWPMN
jgi:hypothetical protein